MYLKEIPCINKVTIPDHTEGYKELQDVTGGYKGSQGGYKGLQGVAMGYRELQGITRGYQGVARGYRGLQWVTGSQDVTVKLIF